jgi:hypothetical protein
MHNLLSFSSNHTSTYTSTISSKTKSTACNGKNEGRQSVFFNFLKGNNLRHSISAIVMVLAVSLNASAVGAECKGQAATLCENDQSCSWVNAYQRKDGRAVKGFCRVKTKGRKPTNKTATKLKTATPLKAK